MEAINDLEMLHHFGLSRHWEDLWDEVGKFFFLFTWGNDLLTYFLFFIFGFAGKVMKELFVESFYRYKGKGKRKREEEEEEDPFSS